MGMGVTVDEKTVEGSQPHIQTQRRATKQIEIFLMMTSLDPNDKKFSQKMLYFIN
jgi:hypothetical protein